MGGGSIDSPVLVVTIKVASNIVGGTTLFWSGTLEAGIFEKLAHKLVHQPGKFTTVKRSSTARSVPHPTLHRYLSFLLMFGRSSSTFSIGLSV